MSEHPILFSGPMVRAILSGAKTRTRRVMQPQPIQDENGHWLWRDNPTTWRQPPEYILADCPYGKPGDPCHADVLLRLANQ